MFLELWYYLRKVSNYFKFMIYVDVSMHFLSYLCFHISSLVLHYFTALFLKEKSMQGFCLRF